MRRPHFLLCLLALIAAGCGNIGDPVPASGSSGSGSGGGSSSSGSSGGPAAPMQGSSASVTAGVLARRCTFAGGNRSPALSWTGIPAGTRSFAIVMDDPDAQAVAGLVWAHWLVVDIPATTTSLAEDGPLPAAARQGWTSGDALGYEGPDPPSGDHTYRLRIYALSAATLSIDLTRTWTRSQFQAAFAGQILGSVELSFRAGASSRAPG